MRQSEFKKKYDPDIGKYTRQHIYGGGTASRTRGGVMDTVKSFLGKKPTKKVQFAAPPPSKPSPAVVKKDAGFKIVKMLSGENPPSRKKNKRQAPMTQQEINNRVLRTNYVWIWKKKVI